MIKLCNGTKFITKVCFIETKITIIGLSYGRHKTCLYREESIYSIATLIKVTVEAFIPKGQLKKFVLRDLLLRKIWYKGLLFAISSIFNLLALHWGQNLILDYLICTIFIFFSLLLTFCCQKYWQFYTR